MKKKLLNILIVFISLITSCGPHNDNPGIVSIGQTVVLKSENEEIAEITYNSCDDEEVEDKDKVMIIENVSIKPLTEFRFDDYIFYLDVCFFSDNGDDDKYFLDKNTNVLKNGYYFFDNDLKEEVNYDFCFIVPKEKRGIKYNETGISFRFFSYFILDYSFLYRENIKTTKTL